MSGFFRIAGHSHLGADLEYEDSRVESEIVESLTGWLLLFINFGAYCFYAIQNIDANFDCVLPH